MMTGIGKPREGLTQDDFQTESLGENRFETPLALPENFWCDDDRRILYHNVLEPNYNLEIEQLLSFERAGPYRQIHFNPKKVNAGVVTCGGLCPGLNDVIRSITYACHSYGVKTVYGFRYGFQGLTSEYAKSAFQLTPDTVCGIHNEGGTILSSSRGPQSVEDMVDTLVQYNISMLFVIGGDGSQHGSMALVQEIKRRKLDISVIGIPKTIDNDISFVHKTFGFDTAVEQARKAIQTAHTEARGAENGVGIVKLMGRHSGYIAAHATIASGDVNICLIPEVPVDFHALMERVKNRLKTKSHVVLVVAEGVGQELLYAEAEKEYDRSGNLKLKDIGIFFKEHIGEELKKEGIPHTIKYIDPSYMIRSTPANASDSAFCLHLGINAVHAGMAGKTNVLVGYWNHHFSLVPIKLAVKEKKILDVNTTLWRTIMEITLT